MSTIKDLPDLDSIIIEENEEKDLFKSNYHEEDSKQ